MGPAGNLDLWRYRQATFDSSGNIISYSKNRRIDRPFNLEDILDQERKLFDSDKTVEPKAIKMKRK